MKNREYIIYRILNLKTKKFYIGKTCQNLNKRWKSHKADGRHGNKYSKFKGQSYLYRSMRKHGLGNFEIKQIDLSVNYLHGCFLEQFYIKYYNTMDPKYGYNMILENSNEVKYFKDETRNQIRLKSYKRMAAEGKTGVSWDKGTNKWALNFEYDEVKISKTFLLKEDAEQMKDVLSLLFYKENAILIHPDKIYLYKNIDLKKILESILMEKKKNKYNYIFKNKSKYTVVFSLKEGSVSNNRYFGTYSHEEEAALIADKLNYFLNGETKKNKFNFPILVDETYIKEGQDIYIKYTTPLP